MDSVQKDWVRFALTAAAGALILAAFSCMKAKARVTLVDKETAAYYVGCQKVGPERYYGFNHYWLEHCSGRVTNQSNTIAYKVYVRVRFGRGAVVSQLIDKVNLEPGEVGAFAADGDSVSVYSPGGYNERPEAPTVTASVSVSWQ
ncbi:MAG: hypothetical protein NTX53_03390 [candidate division WOR-3 bacterium]|nr:hypothetical protein [candidate division WOR-3 bacterium]